MRVGRAGRKGGCAGGGGEGGALASAQLPPRFMSHQPIQQFCLSARCSSLHQSKPISVPKPGPKDSPVYMYISQQAKCACLCIHSITGAGSLFLYFGLGFDFPRLRFLSHSPSLYKGGLLSERGKSVPQCTPSLHLCSLSNAPNNKYYDHLLKQQGQGHHVHPEYQIPLTSMCHSGRREHSSMG